MRPLKRIDLLLAAFSAMRSKRPKRLLILAGGQLRAARSICLMPLPIATRVLVREDILKVEDYLAAADAGLYTSETESFGLSILETQFHGRPVVAFRVGGIPEVVIDGETGFLRPFGDIGALAAALDQLAAAPDVAGRMGQAARQQAQARFSAGIVVPRYEAIYSQLVSGKQPERSGVGVVMPSA